MTYLFLFGGLFLGWSFGRNNLSNVFGTAIGTRMISFRTAACLAGLCILSGALLSGAETTGTMRQLASISTWGGAFWVSVAIALTILIISHLGIPVSMAQSAVGALIGWNLWQQLPNNWGLIEQMLGAWFYCPVIAGLFSMLFFYGTRYILSKVKIPLLYRDGVIRFLLMVSGMYSAYFLGANNMSAIAGPYLGIGSLSVSFIMFSIGLAIALGAFMADRRVIETVSTGLYPLSPLEALVVVIGCGVTLACFSGQGMNDILLRLNLPLLPLVPVPSSGVLVGSIMGVGFAKGQAGIRWSAFAKVVLSWILVPVISCLICLGILAILVKGGSFL